MPFRLSSAGKRPKMLIKTEAFENGPFLVRTVEKRQILSLPSAFSGVLLVWTTKAKTHKKVSVLNENASVWTGVTTRRR